jgi:hypothetical protein
MNRPVASAVAFLSPFFICGGMGLPVNGLVLIGIGFALAIFVDKYA